MNHKINKIALTLTIMLIAVLVWLLVVFIINKNHKLEQRKTFYWFGWCPAGTTDKFDQSQNAFMPTDLILKNNLCCPSGYYGTVTLKGRNICCRNKFDCSAD